MSGIEGALLDHAVAAGRPRRYVQIPTAAGLEGADRLQWWINLGIAQADRLDAEAVPIRVTTRAEADDPALAALVEDAGLIYLSGGKPSHLADTLRGTAVWSAVLRAWDQGAALSGCSAGAMVMAGWIPDVRNPIGDGTEGLGVTPAMRVLPHFDRWMGRMPDTLLRPMTRARSEVTVIGVDEETALVHGLGTPEGTWQVHGVRSAWILERKGRTRLASGESVQLAPPMSGSGPSA